MKTDDREVSIRFWIECCVFTTAWVPPSQIQVRSDFQSRRELVAVTQLWPLSPVGTLADKVSKDSNVRSANYSSSWVDLLNIKGESGRYVQVKCYTVSDNFLRLELVCFVTVSTEHGWDAKTYWKLTTRPSRHLILTLPKNNPLGLQREN